MEFEMLELKIPKWLLVGIEKEELVKDVKLFTAMRFYETNVLSLGKAAEFAGENKDEFMEALSEHGVDVVRYSKKELDAEVEFLNVIK